MITKYVFTVTLTFLFLLFFSSSTVVAQGSGSYSNSPGTVRITGYDTYGNLLSAGVYWRKTSNPGAGTTGSGSMSNGYFGASLSTGTYSYTISSFRCTATSDSFTIFSNKITYRTIYVPCSTSPTAIPTKKPTATPTPTPAYTTVTACTIQSWGGAIKGGYITPSGSIGSYGPTGSNGCTTFTVKKGSYKFSATASGYKKGYQNAAIDKTYQTVKITLYPNPTSTPRPTARPTAIPTRHPELPTLTPTKAAMTTNVELTICVKKDGGGPIDATLAIAGYYASSVPTGADGCYGVPFTKGTTVSVTASADAFESKTRSIAITKNQTATTQTEIFYLIPKSATKTNPGGGSSIPYAGFIKGKVVGTKGEPLLNVEIKALGSPTKYRYTVYTNDKGEYQIGVPFPGTYSLESVVITTDSIYKGYRSYPDITFEKSPQKTVIRNFSLRPKEVSVPSLSEAPYTIEGTIYQQDASGNTAPYTGNTLEIRAFNTSNQSTKALFNGDGTFSIGPLRRESYDVRIMPSTGLVVLSDPTVPVRFSPSSTVKNVSFTIQGKETGSKSPTIAPISPHVTQRITAIPEPTDEDTELPIVSSKPTTGQPTIQPRYNPDINEDSTIDSVDFIILSCELRGNGTCAETGSEKKADVNKDGTVNLIDFIIWRNTRKN